MTMGSTTEITMTHHEKLDQAFDRLQELPKEERCAALAYLSGAMVSRVKMRGTDKIAVSDIVEMIARAVRSRGVKPK